ncbi:MAG TPA: DUF305 domain-containing protein, partial [Gemmatimonadaceae bacterium]|nr:DUF305 domain-containing protein [Gemmatimonadaceae bacterium]
MSHTLPPYYSLRRSAIAGALAAFASMLAHSASAQAQQSSPPMPAMAGMAAHDSIAIPAGVLYTVADVEFMQGMIAHHSQAIYMSRMAEAHRASPRLLRLAKKIDQS